MRRNVTGRLANLRDDIDRWEKVRRELDDTSTLELLAREEEDESVDGKSMRLSLR